MTRYVLAILFAFRGGMFTAGDARALAQKEEVLTAELRVLRRQVDSLRAFADSLESSPVVQERVAREFGALQQSFDSGRTADVVFHVFDVPYVDGHDLRGVPLVERRQVLARLLAATSTATGK